MSFCASASEPASTARLKSATIWRQSAAHATPCAPITTQQASHRRRRWIIAMILFVRISSRIVLRPFYPAGKLEHILLTSTSWHYRSGPAVLRWLTPDDRGHPIRPATESPG